MVVPRWRAIGASAPSHQVMPLSTELARGGVKETPIWALDAFHPDPSSPAGSALEADPCSVAVGLRFMLMALASEGHGQGDSNWKCARARQVAGKCAPCGDVTDGEPLRG